MRYLVAASLIVAVFVSSPRRAEACSCSDEGLDVVVTMPADTQVDVATNTAILVTGTGLYQVLGVAVELIDTQTSAEVVLASRQTFERAFQTSQLLVPAGELEPQHDYRIAVNGDIVATFTTGAGPAPAVELDGSITEITSRRWTAGPWSCVDTSCGNPDGDSSLRLAYHADSDAVLSVVRIDDGDGTLTEIPLSIWRNIVDQDYLGDGFCSTSLPGGVRPGTEYCATLISYDATGTGHAGAPLCTRAQECQLAIESDGWCTGTDECYAPGTPIGGEGGCSTTSGHTGAGFLVILAALAAIVPWRRRVRCVH